VRDDVATINASPFLDEDIPVRGFVYDVNAGRLREIS
jgi:carbonic anhydrase